MPSKARPRTARRPSRAVQNKPTAARSRAAGKGGRTPAPGKRPRATAKPRLLSDGNPQIARADGDAPVQAYIAAMPGYSDVPLRRPHLTAA